jgi:DNA-binding CsgD family transcriptional regulator
MVGRTAECETVDSLLADGRAGHGAAVVVLGEPGIGKTALLDYAASRASDWEVIRASGVESEMELPFAGLHQLCAPLLERLDRLPVPQRDALGTAFGLNAGPVPSPFLVGLAVLGLLSDAADALPLLCLVDDAQWLDQASVEVLAFVARRLLGEPVVLVFAVRDPSEAFRGLHELIVKGLSDPDARRLLGSVVVGPLDESVRERILAESRGNPLALLELPRGLTSAELAGGFALPDALPLSIRIEESFLRRLRPFSRDTRLLLIVAAAEPVGDPTAVWRAADRLGVSRDALEPAQSAGLVEAGTRLRFRHPLVRSAVYRSALPSDRRAAHGALAEVTDAVAEADRRAWHRAEATAVPDEDVATELERSADRAQRRGGIAAAAAFLERATAITPSPAQRAQRALAAARLKHLAGAPAVALSLLAGAESGPLDEYGQAIAQRLRGQIALDMRQPLDALPLLVDAGKRLETFDVELARFTHLEAVRAASVAGRLGGGMLEAARAARTAPRPSGPPRAIDLLLDGLAARFTEGYASSAQALKHALSAVRDEGARPDPDARWPWQARRVAVELFDDDAWHALATRSVQIARETGALAVLPLALNYLAYLRIVEGSLEAAEVLLLEADAIGSAVGAEPIVWGRLYLVGWRGDKAAASPVFEEGQRTAVARREGVLLTIGEHMRAVLHNGLGEYEEARAAAHSLSMRDELGESVWSLAELVEAGVRSGRADLAAHALGLLRERTGAAGTALALGIYARASAMLDYGEAAERLYKEAVERLGGTRVRVHLARAYLLYGEWLRRERRVLEAREQLRTAQEMFSDMGTAAFAKRAERELMATGEHIRSRKSATHEELTPQETEVAALASDGLSNAEIGARIFISPSTVEYHLHKVFRKLGVKSRSQLARKLTTGEQGPDILFPGVSD